MRSRAIAAEVRPLLQLRVGRFLAPGFLKAKDK